MSERDKSMDMIISESSELVPLNYEEFVAAMSPSDEGFIGKAALLISRIPSCLQQLSNFDPTGISGYFLGISNDTVESIEKKKMQKVLYSLYLSLVSLKDQIDTISQNSRESIMEQIELFVGKSLNEIQDEKTAYFRQLLCNGLICFEKPLDEKLLAWNTVAALTAAEMTILIYAIKRKTKIADKSGSGYTEKAIDIQQDCETLGMSREALSAICYSLQGRGLLRSCAGTRITSDQTLFYPSCFAELICSYIQ